MELSFVPDILCFGPARNDRFLDHDSRFSTTMVNQPSRLSYSGWTINALGVWIDPLRVNCSAKIMERKWYKITKKIIYFSELWILSWHTQCKQILKSDIHCRQWWANPNPNLYSPNFPFDLKIFKAAELDLIWHFRKGGFGRWGGFGFEFELSWICPLLKMGVIDSPAANRRMFIWMA